MLHYDPFVCVFVFTVVVVLEATVLWKRGLVIFFGGLEIFVFVALSMFNFFIVFN